MGVNGASVISSLLPTRPARGNDCGDLWTWHKSPRSTHEQQLVVSPDSEAGWGRCWLGPLPTGGWNEWECSRSFPHTPGLWTE